MHRPMLSCGAPSSTKLGKSMEHWPVARAFSCPSPVGGVPAGRVYIRTQHAHAHTHVISSCDLFSRLLSHLFSPVLYRGNVKLCLKQNKATYPGSQEWSRTSCSRTKVEMGVKLLILPHRSLTARAREQGYTSMCLARKMAHRRPPSRK